MSFWLQVEVNEKSLKKWKKLRKNGLFFVHFLFASGFNTPPLAVGSIRDGFSDNVDNGNFNIGDVVFRNIRQTHVDDRGTVFFSVETQFSTGPNPHFFPLWGGGDWNVQQMSIGPLEGTNILIVQTGVIGRFRLRR